MIYLDSSVMLSVYLDEDGADDIIRIIEGRTTLVGSWLLPMEVYVSLRRNVGRVVEAQSFVEDTLSRFDEDLGDIELMEDVGAVSDRIRDDPRLARCRTLDAIHVASALWWQESTASPVRVATLDRRVAEVSQAVGLELALPI